MRPKTVVNTVRADSACLSFALSLDAADTLAKRGIQLVAARETYLRYALEGATVVSI